VRFQVLEEEMDSLDAMGLAGSDVLLLATGGDHEVLLAEDVNVADDSAKATVEQAKSEILIGDEAALFAGFGGQAQDAGPAKADDAAATTDFEVVLAGIKGEANGDLLAVVEGFAGRFLGSDDQEFDLAKPELTVAGLGVKGKDFFGGLQDSFGDEGGTVGAGFNTAAEQVIEGFGIGPLLPFLIVDRSGMDHRRHLRSKHHLLVR